MPKNKKNSQMGENARDSAMNILKKIVSTGLDAAAKTEDVVKEVKDVFHDLTPSSKEAVAALMGNIKVAKEELISAIASKLEERIPEINIRDEIKAVLDNYDFEFKGTVSFKKKE